MRLLKKPQQRRREGGFREGVCKDISVLHEERMATFCVNPCCSVEMRRPRGGRVFLSSGKSKAKLRMCAFATRARVVSPSDYVAGRGAVATLRQESRALERAGPVS